MQSSREITKWMKLSLFHNFILSLSILFIISPCTRVHCWCFPLLPLYLLYWFNLWGFNVEFNSCWWNVHVKYLSCVWVLAKNAPSSPHRHIHLLFSLLVVYKAAEKKVNEDDENNNNNNTPLYELAAGWLYFKGSFLCTLQFLSTNTHPWICTYIYVYEFVIDFARLLYNFNALKGYKVVVLWEILKNALLHSHIHHLRLLFAYIITH